MSEFILETYLAQLNTAKTIDDCAKVPIPTTQSDQNYIFVSYSHKDYKSVYYDLAHLYCRGVRFWYDKGLSAGEDWEREVKEHIQDPRCCGIIFYLSTNMFLSDSVFKEIEFTKLKKRPSILPQKNYFCVNLQNDNISDMLFSAQDIQRKNGLPLLDTKKLNLLTSAFSDNDTYVKFHNPQHTEELIEQIQRKFDVTNKPDAVSANELSLDSIKNPRLALFAFVTRETDPVPLFKFLYFDFKKTKRTRPWYLLAFGLIAGLIASVLMLHRLCTMNADPVVTAVFSFCDVRLFAALSIVWSLAFVPYMTAKSFWLLYISPIAQHAEKGVLAKVSHCLWFFAISLLFAAVSAPVCLCFVHLVLYLKGDTAPFWDSLGS